MKASSKKMTKYQSKGQVEKKSGTGASSLLTRPSTRDKNLGKAISKSGIPFGRSIGSAVTAIGNKTKKVEDKVISGVGKVAGKISEAAGKVSSTAKSMTETKKAAPKKMYGGKMKKMMTGGMANPNKGAVVSSGPSTGVVPGMNKSQPAPVEKFKPGMGSYKKGGMVKASMKKMGKKK